MAIDRNAHPITVAEAVQTLTELADEIAAHDHNAGRIGNPRPEVLGWAARRLEAMNESLWLIRDWANTFPVKAYPELSREQRERAYRAMEEAGVSGEQVQANWARAILDDIKGIANEGVDIREPEDA